MPKKFLYVQPEESIAYVIDKITDTPEPDIYLAVDANPSIFTDTINLKLLKKESDSLSKHIIIVSKTQAVLETAGKSGFETSSNDIQEEETDANAIPVVVHENIPGEITASKNVVQEFEIPDATEDSLKNDLPSWMHKKSTEEAGSEENIRETAEDRPTKSAQRTLSWKLISISIIVIVGLAIGGFYLLTPKVTLNITIKKAPLNLDFKVVSDAAVSAIDAKNAKIPGQLIKLDKELTEQFSATGKQDKESKAEGEITVYNEFGAGSQKLIKNTRFKNKDGLIFHLKNDVVVPGATVKDGKVTAPGIITALIIADQPGPDYNIGPADFTIPGFEGTPKFIAFYGKSSSPMTGGAIGGNKFVSKEDLAGAQTALIAKFNKSEEEFIGNNLPAGTKTLPRAKGEPSFEFSADLVGQDGKFNGKLKAHSNVFAFSENDIYSLVDQYLSGKLSDAQTLEQGSRNVSYADETLGANNLSLSFTVKVSQFIKGKIDENKIKNDLAGKNEEGMKEILKNNEAIESAEFTFWPIWISVAPKNLEKIIISIHE